MRVHVLNEYGALRSVILGRATTFYMHNPINVVQKRYYISDAPTVDTLVAEQDAFVKVIADYGARIHWAIPQADSPNQIFVRDVATVIGDTLVIGAMKEPLRQREPLALGSIEAMCEDPIIKVSSGILEGGDVLLDGTRLYVGISERTNPSGLQWLVEHFGEPFEVVPLRLAHPFLHADVVFNILGHRVALVYPPALDERSMKVIQSTFDVVEVTSEEQFGLATNVFSLDQNTVVADEQHQRVNKLLEERGFTVIHLNYSEVRKMGGSFRCSACPLERA